MPLAAPRLCDCGKIVPAGQRCACQIARKRETDARHEQRRPNAQERGYGSKWQEARAAFLAAHPTCEQCGKPSTVLDHKTPHRGDAKLFWSRSNWQALCQHCHNSWKQRIERQERRQ